MGDCDRCDGDDHISYTCNECGGRYCSQHRLPENHGCEALRSKSSSSWFKDGLSSRQNRGGESIKRTDSPAEGDRSTSVDSQGGDSDSTKSSADDANSGPAMCGVCGEDAYLTCDDCSEQFCDVHIQTTRHDCPDAPAHRTGTATNGTPSDRASAASRTSGLPTRVLGAIRTAPFVVVGLLLSLLLLPVRNPKLGLLLGLAVVGGVVVTDGLGPSVADVERAAADVERGVSNVANSTDSGFDADRVEVLVHQRVNEIRSNRGLNTLTHDTRLRTIASDYSERMATEGFYSHRSPSGETFEDRYEDAGYNCRIDVGSNRYVTGAENILYTYAETDVQLDNGSVQQYDSESELANAIVRSWMNSADHRETILERYWRNEGIGVHIIDNPDGPGKKVYATQNFC